LRKRRGVRRSQSRVACRALAKLRVGDNQRILPAGRSILQPQQIAPARQISEGIEVDEEDLIFVNQSAEGKQVELSLRRNQK
jgi:hypothetical protein